VSQCNVQAFLLYKLILLLLLLLTFTTAVTTTTATTTTTTTILLRLLPLLLLVIQGLTLTQSKSIVAHQGIGTTDTIYAHIQTYTHTYAHTNQIKPNNLITLHKPHTHSYTHRRCNKLQTVCHECILQWYVLVCVCVCVCILLRVCIRTTYL
jgi:hypothetical protein